MLRYAFFGTVVVIAVAVLPAGAQVADTTEPVVTCGSADTAWHADDVSIACTAEDPESGIPNPDDRAFNLTTNVPDGTETADAATDTRQVCNGATPDPLCATAGPIPGNMVDKRTPRNPSRIRSSDHVVQRWSRDRRISMVFNAGADGGSRVDGFSIAWTRIATSLPDQTIDRQQTARGATSGLLGNGRWYFHIRTGDNVGNWSGAAHRGPYLIDRARPSVRALAASGRVGRTLRLRYRTADNNGRTRERLTVLRSGSVVRSWTRGMATARWRLIQSALWTPSTAGAYAFCVQAWDPAGNARRDCAGVSVTRPAPAPSRCHASYPTVCIPSPPPDLDCGQIRHTDFAVRPPDPHGFDGDGDGVGCET